MDVQLKIYLVHAMSGLKWEEVESYYKRTKTDLDALGYQTMHPMCAKSELKGNRFDPKASDVKGSAVGAHAITRRDHFMVRTANIVFADLSGCKRISIGSVSEIATAYELGKHTVGVMEKGNVHEHAFMQEQLDVIFETYEEALNYLKKFIKGEY